MFLDEAMGLNPDVYRLRADSVMSIRDMAASATPEDIQALLRALTDKTKQIEELHRASEAATLDHEEELYKLQEKMEEVTKELSSKRKEEKDVRGRLKQATDLIATLETEVQRQTTRAESIKEMHAAAKKQLEEQRSQLPKTLGFCTRSNSLFV